MRVKEGKGQNRGGLEQGFREREVVEEKLRWGVGVYNQGSERAGSGLELEFRDREGMIRMSVQGWNKGSERKLY